MNNSRSGFLIFAFCNPHSLESGEWWQYRSTDPNQEFSLLRSKNFNFHGCGGKSSDFFAKSFWNTREHGSSTTHDYVGIQVFSDINITLQNGLISNFVEARHFLSNRKWLKESFWASEFLATNVDSLTVREFVIWIIIACVIF